MRKYWAIPVLASILILGVFVPMQNGYAVPSTLWQIGNIANPNVNSQADGDEFLQTGMHFDMFSYDVDSLNPIDDCNTSQCVNFPIQIGTVNNPGATATTLAKINFSSELCYTEALLTMYKYGSEDDLVRLNGVFQGELAGSAENNFIIVNVPVGPILQDNTLEIEIELLSGGNDRHFVDAIVLEVDDNNQIPCPRTIGFWKNHPVETEEHLSILIGNFLVEDSEDANLVFNVSAKNAHDMLAAQLLAAEINVWNGVPSCQEVNVAIAAAQTLLGETEENYTEPGSTFPPKKGDKGIVNAIKNVLDDFNNNGCS